MASSQSSSPHNLQHALDLVLFEQWLRFYFISEEDGKLFIRMPDDYFELNRKQYPDLFPVAQSLNNREIDHQAALSALCDSMMNGPFALAGKDWAEVLAGEDFRMALQLLSFWVQAEEDELDREILPFDQWRHRFLDWRETPPIRDYAAKLRQSIDGAADFSSKVQ